MRIEPLYKKVATINSKYSNNTDYATLHFNKIKDTVHFSGKSKLIDADSPLLPGFKDNKMNDIGDFTPQKCALVHMTNYFPEYGEIRSTKNATRDENGISQCRSTIHFAINHSVNEHFLGNLWSKMPYAIILPMDKIFVNTDSKNILGGQYIDFSILGNVQLPEGSVIVRRNRNIPKGKLKVIEADENDGIDKNKKVLIVESSEENMQKLANSIVEKMGYSDINKLFASAVGLTEEECEIINDAQKVSDLLNTDIDRYIELSFKVGNNVEVNQKINEGWEKFAKKYKFMPYQQLFLPWHRADSLLNGILILKLNNDSWIVTPEKKDNKDNDEEPVDYKKEFLTVLDEIEKQLPKGKNINYDLNTMRAILNESNSPSDALEKIKDRLFIIPMPIANENSDEKLDNASIYMVIDCFLAISKDKKEFLIYPQFQ